MGLPMTAKVRELSMESIPQIRNRLITEITENPKIKDIMIAIGDSDSFSDSLCTLVYEIKLLVNEYGINALEHGIDSRYIINRENGQLRVAFMNRKRRFKARKLRGEGGRGISIACRYPEVYMPEISSHSKNSFYAVIIDYNLRELEEALLRHFFTKLADDSCEYSFNYF